MVAGGHSLPAPSNGNIVNKGQKTQNGVVPPMTNKKSELTDDQLFEKIHHAICVASRVETDPVFSNQSDHDEAHEYFSKLHRAARRAGNKEPPKKLKLEITSTTTAGQLLAEWRRLDPHTTRTLNDAYTTLCARRS
jgi:hypothetical protein